MGWASGSSLLSSVWSSVRRYIPEEKRVDVLLDLMNIFSDEDCDTLDEIVDEDWPETEQAYEKFNQDN